MLLSEIRIESIDILCSCLDVLRETIGVRNKCCVKSFGQRKVKINQTKNKIYVLPQDSSCWVTMHNIFMCHRLEQVVNQKKIIAGDDVAFMRDSEGTMLVGLRHAVRYINNSDCADGETRLL